MSDADVRAAAERLVAFVAKYDMHPVSHKGLEDAKVVASRLLELLPRVKSESGWRWEMLDGRADLTGPSGQLAATVFGMNSMGWHCWYVWDESGEGGENSCEPSVATAMASAEAAVIRWGKFTITEPTP